MDYQLSDEQKEELFDQAQAGHQGEDFEMSCTFDEQDHFHTKRIGEPGSSVARGVILVHANMRVASVYLAPAQLRQVAAQLLNVADEIDGTTPLSFVEGAPSAEG